MARRVRGGKKRGTGVKKRAKGTCQGGKEDDALAWQAGGGKKSLTSKRGIERESFKMTVMYDGGTLVANSGVLGKKNVGREQTESTIEKRWRGRLGGKKKNLRKKGPAGARIFTLLERAIRQKNLRDRCAKREHH